MALSHPMAFGRYLLESKLATGGMGEVFLARMMGPAGFEKKVVIKRMLPHLAESAEFVERFLDEARLVVQLSHGNLVQVFDMGTEQGHYYLAMEYVDGLDLRQVLHMMRNGEGELPVKLVLHVVAELAKGLAYAHSRAGEDGHNLGIVHRDVKPSNVMVSREGEVKLLDFGIAKAAGRMSHSISGSLHGKFLYMSPEQASGESLDPRSDIFSVGTVAYEMLTGMRPFHGETELRTLDLIKDGSHDKPSVHRDGLPEAVESIIEKCLARDPADRYASADELHHAALSTLVESGEVVSSADLASFLADYLQPRTPTQSVSLDSALNDQLDALLGPPLVLGTQLAPGNEALELRRTPLPLAPNEGGLRMDTSTTGRARLEDLADADVPRASRNRILIASVVVLVGVLVTLNVVMLYALRSEKQNNELPPMPAQPALTPAGGPSTSPGGGQERTPEPRVTLVPRRSAAAEVRPRRRVYTLAQLVGVAAVPPVVSPMVITLTQLPEGAAVTMDGEVVTADDSGRFEVPEGAGDVNIMVTAAGRKPLQLRVPREAGGQQTLGGLGEAIRRPFRVRVQPENARLFSGKRLLGTGSATVMVSADAPFRGRAVLEGYGEKRWTARYGQKGMLVTLTPIQLGSFKVRIFPVSAKVSLDGRPMSRSRAMVSKKVPPGEHQLTISSGAKTKKLSFTVRAGESKSLGQITLE